MNVTHSFTKCIVASPLSTTMHIIVQIDTCKNNSLDLNIWCYNPQQQNYVLDSCHYNRATQAKKYNTILLEIMHNNIDKGSRRKDTDSTWKNYE